MKSAQISRIGIFMVTMASAWMHLSEPAFAQVEKGELIQIIRQEDRPLRAMVVDKLISLNLSEGWWRYVLNRESRTYSVIGSLADSLLDFAKNMGWCDAKQLDESGDASNPMVAQCIDSLQDKVHCTIELQNNVKENYQAQTIENLAMFEKPITEKYYCNPRGGKLNVTITLDASSQSMKCQVSKDGTAYHFTFPAYSEVMTSPIESAFKQGS